MGRRRFLQLISAALASFGAWFRPMIAGGQVSEPIVTSDPETLTLAPGESAPVMVSVDPTSPYGQGSVTIPVTVPVPYDGTIEGDTAVTVPAGQHWHVTGDINLLGDLIIEGRCTSVKSFHLEGNGFQILVQHGGQLDWQGIPKSGSKLWGETPIGWQSGDRLVITPTAVGAFTPTEGLWTDDWNTLIRPSESPDVLLADQTTIRPPEVGNLTRSITLRNLRRIHFHDGPGVQVLKHLAIVDSGITGVLGEYPLHFHLCGDSVRGSLVEGVVVEGGKNHALVPHASHGITFRDFVVYKTIGDAFWWDRPPPGTRFLSPENVINDSHDITVEQGMVVWVLPVPGEKNNRLTAFMLGQGFGNAISDTVAACVQGGTGSSGYQWPEGGEGVWTSQRLRAHNNVSFGIFVWQNGPTPNHHVLDFEATRNGLAGVRHGAYRNTYHYERLILTGNGVAMSVSALSSDNPGDVLLIEDVIADTVLAIGDHSQPSINPVVYRNVQFPGVKVNEVPKTGGWHPKV